ncbi:MAG TPA: nuclease A inhibitor family protein [Allocoleopsis sp.]
MLNFKETAILSLALTFSLQLSFEASVSSQSSQGSPAKLVQNLSCQSQQRQLLNATEGLLYPSESNYAFEYFSHTQADSLATAKEFSTLVGKPGKQVTQVEFDEFFNQLITNLRSSKAEVDTIKRYESLRQVLKNNFKNLTVYRVGQIQVQVYITGVNSCGIAGLKTISIET